MVLYKIKIIIITSTLVSASETPFKYRALVSHLYNAYITSVTYYDNLFDIICYD